MKSDSILPISEMTKEEIADLKSGCETTLKDILDIISKDSFRESHKFSEDQNKWIDKAVNFTKETDYFKSEEAEKISNNNSILGIVHGGIQEWIEYSEAE